MKTNLKFDLNRIDEETMEGPIVKTVIEDDFYKFPMGMFNWSHLEYRNAQVKWEFKNRKHDLLLAEYISEKDFYEQVGYLSNDFGIDQTAYFYLNGINIYGNRMFSDDYLESLRTIQFPKINFSTNKGQIKINWEDENNVASHAEMPVIRIISGLFARSLLKKMSRLERESVYTEGTKRLWNKIQKLKENPHVSFSDFSNRRTPSGVLHEYIVVRTAEELGFGKDKQFRGTSKTSLAMKYGLDPIGTIAHQQYMQVTALMFDGTKESIARAQVWLHQEWFDQFGEGIALSLPDTYGTEFTLNSLPDEMIRKLKGIRIDSMDPMKAIPIAQARFSGAGANYKEKLYIPSDELTIDKMIEISTKFRGEGIISHGIGGGFGNDFGLPKLSIVCKAVEINGKPCVKLSDNPEKAIGDPKEVRRYKQALGIETLQPA